MLWIKYAADTANHTRYGNFVKLFARHDNKACHLYFLWASIHPFIIDMIKFEILVWAPVCTPVGCGHCAIVGLPVGTRPSAWELKRWQSRCTWGCSCHQGGRCMLSGWQFNAIRVKIQCRHVAWQSNAIRVVKMPPGCSCGGSSGWPSGCPSGWRSEACQDADCGGRVVVRISIGTTVNRESKVWVAIGICGWLTTAPPPRSPSLGDSLGAVLDASLANHQS